MKTTLRNRTMLLVAAMVIVSAASTYMRADTGTCGGASITLPFTDVPAANVFFCSIAEAYFSALTNGTSPTTYNPGDPVPREQMAAFVTRTLDQSVKRSSRRAALQQFWTIQTEDNLGLTDVGDGPTLVQSDGADVWVANFTSATVTRVKGNDGSRVADWTGATNANGVLSAMGKVFITGDTTPSGTLYQIDPTQPAGNVTILSNALGGLSAGIAFDGKRIWTANFSGSISIVTLNPVFVSNVSTGFLGPLGLLYDGANIWVVDTVDAKIKKLDSSGNILLSVNVGVGPSYPAFDGTNIWVGSQDTNSVSVVRATGSLSGTVLANLSGNGLNNPFVTAFDGERILVTNYNGNSISLFKASDLTPIGTISTGAGTAPVGACSDGVNFWIALHATNKLARF